MTTPAEMREFYELLGAHCEDMLTAEQAAKLQALVLGDADLRQRFILCMHIQAVAERSLGVLLPSLGASAKQRGEIMPPRPKSAQGHGTPCGGSAPPSSPVLGFLNRLLRVGHETPMNAALTWLVMAVVCSGIVLTLISCIVLVFRGPGVKVRDVGPQVANNPTSTVPRLREDGGEARGDGRVVEGNAPAIPHPSSFILPHSPPSSASVARLIHIDEPRWAVGSHSPHLGDDLEPGRRLVLLSGLAEVMFQSGVRALLEGPATMEIGSRKSALLRRGRLTVTVVDPDGHGFEVQTPGMKYTDLGTEFGVSVAKDGTQEMHVFRGRVQAESQISNLPLFPKLTGEMGNPPPLPAGHALGGSKPMVLTADQAIRVAAPDKPIERIAADEKQFVRAMRPLDVFPLFGTGIGLDRGAADAHWEIVDVSTDPDFKPRPAVVARSLDQFYVPGSRDKGQWVAVDAGPRNYPEGCRWTYRTKFDLSGFDANSAIIEGQFAADNLIEEVRLNGRLLPLADHGEFTKYHPILIEKGFVAENNVLEITILNRSDDGTTVPSPMGLCVQWKGTARRVSGAKETAAQNH